VIDIEELAAFGGEALIDIPAGMYDASQGRITDPVMKFGL
jgi:hypothetical protein